MNRTPAPTGTSPLAESPPRPEPTAPRRASPGRVAALFFLVSLVVFNANLRTTASFDGLAASLIPFGLWHGEGVTLDAHGGKLPPEIGYSIVRSKHGRWVSLYPIVTPLLVSPLYAPTLWVPWFRPEDPELGSVVRSVMEKLSASVLAALSVAVVFLLLRKRASHRDATFLTAAYAFGTSTWAISSQQLGQHAAAQLLLALCLLILVGVRPLRLPGLALLGLLAGLLTANRPQDVFFSAAIAWIVLRRHGRRSWPFAVAAGLVAAGLVAYNLTHFSGVTGGYGDYRLPGGGRLEPSFPLLSAIAGLLISNRGLLTFSPFFLLLLFRPRAIAGPRPETAVLATAWACTVLFYASYPGWSGGYTYGPRYLADGLPLLVLFVAGPVASVRSLTGRALLAVSVLFAISLQFVGAFCYPGGDSGNERFGFWSLSRSSPVLAARSGLQPPHFLPLVAPTLVMRGALSPSDARGELRWAEAPPARALADSRLDLEVEVTNRGRRRWSSLGNWFGRDAVRLAAWWTRDDGRAVPGSARTEAWLSGGLDPGETTVKDIRPLAPAVAGSYLLNLGVLQVGGVSAAPSTEGVGALQTIVDVTPAGPTEDRRVAWGGVEGPAEMLSEQRSRFLVRLRNGSTTPWTPNVHLSYHWRGQDGGALLREGERAKLVPLAERDGFGVYPIEVLANVRPGRYRLEFDLVEEGVAWFGTHGSPTLGADVTVRPAPSSPGAFAPLPREAFRAEIAVPDLSPRMRAGATLYPEVRVRNLSTVPFPADGRIAGGQRVNLTYRWLDAGGSVVIPDGVRTPLPSPLAPGATVSLRAVVVVPSRPGEYLLELDLVQEDVDWFGTRGSRTTRTRVRVD